MLEHGYSDSDEDNDMNDTCSNASDMSEEPVRLNIAEVRVLCFNEIVWFNLSFAGH